MSRRRSATQSRLERERAERIRDTPPTAVERQHFTNLYGRAVRESRGIPLPTMADRQQFANLFGSPTRAERRNFANLYGPRTAAESQHMTDLLRRAERTKSVNYGSNYAFLNYGRTEESNRRYEENLQSARDMLYDTWLENSQRATHYIPPPTMNERRLSHSPSPSRRL